MEPVSKLLNALAVIVDVTSSLKLDEDHPHCDTYRDIMDLAHKFISCTNEVLERAPEIKPKLADIKDSIQAPDMDWMTGASKPPAGYFEGLKAKYSRSAPLAISQ